MPRPARLAARAVAVAALLAAAWSCRDFLVDPANAGLPGAGRTLRIAPSRLDLVVGGKATVTATLLDASGAVVEVPSGFTLTYTSSAPQVFATDARGVTTGVAEGEGVLRAAVGALIVGIPVRVVSSGPRLVIVSGDGQSGAPGATLALPLVVRAVLADGTPARDVTVDWEASAGVATPARSATDAAGEATTGWTLGPTAGAQALTARAAGFASATFAATAVVRPVASVVVTPSAVALADVAQTVQLDAVARDADGQPVPVAGFTWSSSNVAVATVTSTGLVTSVGAGSTSVTAAIGAISGSSTVTVTLPQPQARLAFRPDTLKAAVTSGAQVVAAVDVFEAGGQPASTLGTVSCDAATYEGTPPAQWLTVQSCGDSVRVLVNAAALPAGTWRANVPVRATLASNSPASLPVEVTVAAAGGNARLGVVPGVAAGIGYTNGPSVRVAVDVVELNGVGEAALGAVACLEQAGNPEYFFLLSCGDSVVYEMRTGGNLEGTLEGSVRVTAANVTDTLTLPLRITAARPVLRFVPDSLAAAAQAGGAAVRVASAVTIEVLPGAPAYPRSSLGALACTLSAPAGAPPATVERCADSVAVVVTPGAAAGTYRYTVEVRAPDAEVTVVASTLPVTVTVAPSASPPVIAATPAGPITITTPFGNDGQVAARLLTITNAGGGMLTGLDATITYTPGQLADWIEVGFDSTTAPTAMYVDVWRFIMPPGTYDATVRVTSTVAGVQPLDIPVHVTVTAPTARIGLDPDSMVVRSFTGGPPIRAAVAVVELTGQGRAALGTISCSPIRFVEGGGWARLVSCGDSVVVEFNTNDNFNGTDRATIRVTGSSVTDTATLSLRLTAFPPRLAFVPDSLVMTASAGGAPVSASAKVVEADGWIPPGELGALRCTLNAPAGAPPATVSSCTADAVTVSVTPATAGTFRYTVLVESLDGVRKDAALLPVRVTVAPPSGPFTGGPAFGRCALATNGGMYCWGENSSGQVGDGTTTRRLRPVLVRPSQGVFADMDAGGAVSCGRAFQPAVLLCWGTNEAGASGQGHFSGITTSPAPVKFAGNVNNVLRFSVGARTTCAIVDDGTATPLYCWGDNGAGQLGTGSDVAATNLPADPVPIPDQFVGDVAVGSTHACALRGTAPYALFCWGEGWQLGDGTTDSTVVRRTPVYVPFPDDLPANGLVAGADATCLASYNNNRLYCWGSNRNGETGTGGTKPVSTPTQLAFGGITSSYILSLTAGDHHTCAVTAGDTWCWGRNDLGQLGSGTFGGMADVPQRVGGGHSFIMIAAAGNTTCGVEQADGSVWCWGYGLTGELGNGEEGRNAAVPVRVVGP